MPIQPSAEVTEALRSGRPLVALESTLICHGIPRPRNLALAHAVEAAVREAGAVPATVALIGRQDQGRPGAGRARGAGLRRRRGEVLAARPRPRPGRRRAGCHHRGRHHPCRGPAGHPGDGDGRDRRGPSRRRDQPRRLGRPVRAAPLGRGRGVQRGQGHPRPAPHAGGAGDAGRARRGLRHRRLPGVLRPRERPQGTAPPGPGGPCPHRRAPRLPSVGPPAW